MDEKLNHCKPIIIHVCAFSEQHSCRFFDNAEHLSICRHYHDGGDYPLCRCAAAAKEPQP